MDLEQLTDEQLDQILSEEEEYNQRLEAIRFYSGKDHMDHLKKIVELKKGMELDKKYLTKLPALNKMLDGFREGELVIVSGQTGQGKTAFMSSLTRDFSDANEKSVWFSYEVGYVNLAERFGSEIPEVYAPLMTKPADMKWLEDRIWESVAKFGAKIIFIDHLHYLINLDMLAKAKSTSLVIGQLMRDLKLLALKTRTVIFLASHTAKIGEDNKEPDVNDLRDSSFIGQESDVVLFVWRKKSRDEYTDESFLKVAKNRRLGTNGVIRMRLQDHRFKEQVNAY